MAYALILFPLLMAAVVFAIPSRRWRPRVLPVAALAHLFLVVHAVFLATEPIMGLEGWLLLDQLGKLVLGFQSLLFFLCAWYVPAYLDLRLDRPNRVFCANLL